MRPEVDLSIILGGSGDGAAADGDYETLTSERILPGGLGTWRFGFEFISGAGDSALLFSAHQRRCLSA